MKKVPRLNKEKAPDFSIIITPTKEKAERLKVKKSIGRKMKMFTNFDEMPVMLSVPQTAEVLGISRVSVYKLVKTDKSFPAVVMGSRISIPKEQLKAWIDKKAQR